MRELRLKLNLNNYLTCDTRILKTRKKIEQVELLHHI